MGELITPEKAKSIMNAPIKARGFESGIEKEDLVVPRAKLIQPTSPEAMENLPGVKTGSIINSLTKEVLPAEFIPIFVFKNYVKFNPRKKDDPNFDSNFNPGDVIWRSDDPMDPKVVKECAFGPNGETPTAVTFMNFFSYFPGVSMPVIISFSKTSYKAGKLLLSTARFTGGDMFSRKYKLSSAVESNDQGTYAVLKAHVVGVASQDELATCEKLWKDFSLKAKEIIIHEEYTEQF